MSSFFRTDLGWPVPCCNGSKTQGLSEPVPTSGKGFCCRSHSKVHKMGGGHRIQTLPVAYVVGSLSLPGQSLIWGRILDLMSTLGKTSVLISELLCLLLKRDNVWPICFLLPPTRPSLYSWCFACFVCEASQMVSQLLFFLY